MFYKSTNNKVFQALKNVSFKVKIGEKIAIVGNKYFNYF